ncbi:hypothetical protein D3C81_835070 [compost metagenome]
MSETCARAFDGQRTSGSQPARLTPQAGEGLHRRSVMDLAIGASIQDKIFASCNAHDSHHRAPTCAGGRWQATRRVLPPQPDSSLAQAHLAFPSAHPGFPDPVSCGVVVVAVVAGATGRRTVADPAGWLAYRPELAGHGLCGAGAAVAVVGPPPMVHAHHRGVVPDVVVAVRAAGGIHAAVPAGIRHPPQPPLRGVPQQPAGGLGDAVAWLQGRAAAGHAGNGLAGLGRLPLAACAT